MRSRQFSPYPELITKLPPSRGLEFGNRRLLATHIENYRPSMSKPEFTAINVDFIARLRSCSAAALKIATRRFRCGWGIGSAHHPRYLFISAAIYFQYYSRLWKSLAEAMSEAWSTSTTLFISCFIGQSLRRHESTLITAHPAHARVKTLLTIGIKPFERP